MPVTLVWFRQDLRLTDHQALTWAAQRGAVLPAFVLDTTDTHAVGAASRWWLHYSLIALADALKARGLPFVLRQGDPQRIIPELVQTAAADAVTWNRCYEPHAVRRDTAIKQSLRDRGITVATHSGTLLHEPWAIQSRSATPFKVFTPFYRTCLASEPPAAPLEEPAALTPPPQTPTSEQLESWQLLPTKPDWAGGMRAAWPNIGADAAYKQLTRFTADGMAHYQDRRDRPDLLSTSRLSPFLHYGQISPRQVWHAAQAALAVSSAAGIVRNGEGFMRQLIWREFCAQLMFHHADLADAPLQRTFTAFPWRDDTHGLKAWQSGCTGYPIVDAGMRELWQTGWMHNRVRMIAASFLVKDLLLPWQHGERWFRDTLVDADLANNAAGWQWVAGCGTDAAPYFRIFNPTLQSRKFDPQGSYIRRYVPELAALADDTIHDPAADPEACRKAGIILGTTYPLPILDHRAAKERALQALKSLS